MTKLLSSRESQGLLKVLKARFEKNLNRHEGLDWNKISEKLIINPEKLWSLQQMEASGGEPDVIDYDKETDTYSFFDCSLDSPKGRRNLCYDNEAQISATRKPQNNVMDVAEEMGVDLLTPEQYRKLHELDGFDPKTSNWLKTPSNVRALGGAIFGDFRYGEVFIYHNSAQSYYISRGFRAVLKV